MGILMQVPLLLSQSIEKKMISSYIHLVSAVNKTTSFSTLYCVTMD